MCCSLQGFEDIDKYTEEMEQNNELPPMRLKYPEFIRSCSTAREVAGLPSNVLSVYRVIECWEVVPRFILHNMKGVKEPDPRYTRCIQLYQKKREMIFK